jgi:SAM-dependent methyltransferase
MRNDELRAWMQQNNVERPPDGYILPFWWDGPKRFQFVNRNVISAVQRELFYKLVVILAPGKEGWDMGGSGHTILNTRINGLEIDNANDLQADATLLPFKDNSLDFIVSSHSIEHMNNTRKMFKEWYRVLKKDGIIGFIMPDKTHFEHWNSSKEERFDAPSEMTPDECLKIILDNTDFEVLFFNTFQNNFEFEGLLKK